MRLAAMRRQFDFNTNGGADDNDMWKHWKRTRKENTDEDDNDIWKHMTNPDILNQLAREETDKLLKDKE